jgi:undecaprenyl-diphosphatase
VKDFRLPLDERLYHGLNSLALDWLDSIFVAVSSPVFGLTVGAVILAWVAFALKRKAIRPLVQVGAAILFTDQGGALAKELIGRTRPCYALAHDSIRQLCEVGHSGSMPSLHAANSFAFAFALGLCVPGTFRCTLPLATLIAVSRVAVGVHWPSDVLVGALYGTLVGVAANAAGAFFTKRPAVPVDAATRPARPG